MNGEDHSDLGNPSIFQRFFHRRLGPFLPRKEDVKAMEGDMWSKLVTADEANDLIVVNFEFKRCHGRCFFFLFFPAENRKTIPVDAGHGFSLHFFPIFSSISQLKTRKSRKPGLNAKGRPLYGTRPDGLMPRHVYSVLRAVEVPGEIWEEPKRMVCLRNPWGRCEWQGPWKDQGAAQILGDAALRERERDIYICVCVT